MRRIFCTILSLSVILFSCNKGKEITVSSDPDSSKPMGSISIVLENNEDTKVSNVNYATDERPVSHWRYFIFNSSNGQLLLSEEKTGSSAITKRLMVGTYDIYVLANYPQSGAFATAISNVFTKSAFLALTSSLGDNSIGHFVMAGSTSSGQVTVVYSPDPTPCSVTLKRLVSKINLVSVTRSFVNPSLGAKSMSIKHIYLTRVYPQTRVGSDFSVSELNNLKSSWYNAMGYHSEGSMAASTSIDALTCERNLNINLLQGGTQTLNKSFYFCPNPVLPSTNTSGSPWDATTRCTRLVVETEIGSKTYYYLVTLPKIDAYAPILRNYSYDISLVFTQPGSIDPEEDIPGAVDVTFVPSVDTNWDTDYNVEEVS